MNRLSERDRGDAASYVKALNARPSLRFRLAFSESGTWTPRNEEGTLVGPLIGKRTSILTYTLDQYISYYILLYHHIESENAF
jgi:hypothetical protein